MRRARRLRRRHLLLGAVLGIGAAVTAWAWPPAPPSGALRGAPHPDGIWIATFNMNFERLDPDTVAAVAALEADVVFLQETHAGWQAQLAALTSHPHQRFLDAPAEGGMGVISRFPLGPLVVSAPAEARFPATCLDVETPRGTLSALHLHLLPPLSADGSLLVGYHTTPAQRLAELEAHLGCGSGQHDLVLGDLNEGEGPTTARLAAAGFAEVQRALGPPEPTWRWETGLVPLRGRPDHIFTGPRLHVAAAQVVLDSGASDHHPLRAQVVW